MGFVFTTLATPGWTWGWRVQVQSHWFWSSYLMSQSDGLWAFPVELWLTESYWYGSVGGCEYLCLVMQAVSGKIRIINWDKTHVVQGCYCLPKCSAYSIETVLVRNVNLFGSKSRVPTTSTEALWYIPLDKYQHWNEAPIRICQMVMDQIQEVVIHFVCCSIFVHDLDL